MQYHKTSSLLTFPSPCLPVIRVFTVAALHVSRLLTQLTQLFHTLRSGQWIQTHLPTATRCEVTMATCRLGIGKGRWWGHVAGLVMASSCCFSRGGEYFASGGFDGELKVWNTKSGTLHHTFVSTHLNGIHCLSWSREKLVSLILFLMLMLMHDVF